MSTEWEEVFYQTGTKWNHRPTWDETFLEVAQVVAKRATCTRRKVGAVLTLNNRIVSTGYNGAPAGRPHCLDGACPRGQLTHDELPRDADYNQFPCIAVHAEANALLRGNGDTIYITDDPCKQCYNLIIASDIERVVTPSGTYYERSVYQRLSNGGQDYLAGGFV